MDVQRMRKGAVAGGSSLVDLPEYIISTFLPGARPLLDQNPSLFRFLGLIVALYYLGPVARLQSLWKQFSTVVVSTVNVSSEEDLFGYLTTYIAERRTLRADQVLNAMSNNPAQEGRGRRMGPRGEPDFEESKRANEDPKIKYEQGQGVQIFMYKGRLFYCSRKHGDGHTFMGNRYKRIEIMSLTCLGRSPQPVKDLVEHIYYLNKDKERTLTIIRRPYTGGTGSRLTWSRLTSKPRRALDTVILDADQKDNILADVEEYMDEATMNFYASHGIPYRRGYLFHGPPGVGKTSFALAIAAKFNLDVYNLTLLDHDLTDSDLVSLLNQLPGRSLLLLEDIDTAGLNRKGKSTASSRRSNKRDLRLPPGAAARMGNRRADAKNAASSTAAAADDSDLDSDDESGAGTTSRVTLSGLLNAIDGVAAPEGHVLIMTTNKPHELDDALVRAGRISVRVGFKNASKKQAEEIFLRMYVDLPPSAPAAPGVAVQDKQEPSGNAVAPTEQREKINLDLPDDQETARLRALAKEFASLIPDHDFSPADIQDYLLVHKKEPAKAVESLPAWKDEVYEERRRKEEDKEAGKEVKREAKREERRRFREEIKAAVKGVEEEDQAEAEAQAEEGKKSDKQAGKPEGASPGKGNDETATESKSEKKI